MEERRDPERDIWAMHDRRLSEQDTKIYESSKTVETVQHELRQLFERINMGLSPTQNKILEKQNEIERSIQTMDHKVEISLLKIHDLFSQMITKVKEDFEKELSPIRVEHRAIKDDFMKPIRRTLYTLFGGLALIILAAAFRYTFHDRPLFWTELSDTRKP